MKKMFLVAAMSLSLAACDWFPTQTEQPSLEHADTVQKIQEITVKVCSFLPTASSVLAMVTAADPTVTGVINIANAICAVVSTKPGVALLNDCPRVNGVCVSGGFTGHGLMSDYYTKDTCPKVNGVCVDGQKVEKKDGG